MIVKVLLIASVLVSTAFLLRGQASGRRQAVQRLAFIGFAGTWFVAVLSPDIVTWVANQVGVGRGTDLVLYILVVAFLFTILSQQQQMRALHDRMARLTRAVALKDALSPERLEQGSEPTAPRSND